MGFAVAEATGQLVVVRGRAGLGRTTFGRRLGGDGPMWIRLAELLGELIQAVRAQRAGEYPRR